MVDVKHNSLLQNKTKFWKIIVPEMSETTSCEILTAQLPYYNDTYFLKALSISVVSSCFFFSSQV